MRKNKFMRMLSLALCAAVFLMGCSNGNQPKDSRSRVIETPPGQQELADQPSDAPKQEHMGSSGGPSATYGSAFDFETKTVQLNDGNTMPIIGLGTWTQNDATAENSVYHALKEGYRLIDTAKYYGNAAGINAAVTRAIEEGIVTREEVFITTKILPSGFGDYGAVIRECNEALGLGYIDLMLIHQQGPDEIELYRAIEKAIDDGTVRSLGISNYYTPEAFERITKGARIMPGIVQNELHPFYQNTAFNQYVGQHGIIVESYYSFGGRGHTQDLFNHDTILQIAAAHDKTAAQVLLRWQLQAGHIVIPGSSNPSHIAENIDVFNFELSDDEMRMIAQMNTGKRYETW